MPLLKFFKHLHELVELSTKVIVKYMLVTPRLLTGDDDDDVIVVSLKAFQEMEPLQPQVFV